MRQNLDAPPAQYPGVSSIERLGHEYDGSFRKYILRILLAYVMSALSLQSELASRFRMPGL